MSKKDERGFGIVAVLVVVAVALLLGLLVWRIWESSQSPQPPPPRTTQQQPSEDKADVASTYITIKEWGVRFKPHADLVDLSYFKPTAIAEDSFTFTTAELAAEASCSQSSGNIVLGLLTRTTEPQPQFGSSLAKIDNYYYQFRGPQAPCSTHGQAEALALPKLSESLQSLEAAH